MSGRNRLMRQLELRRTLFQTLNTGLIICLCSLTLMACTQTMPVAVSQRCPQLPRVPAELANPASVNALEQTEQNFKDFTQSN